MSVPPDYMYGLDGSLNNSLYNPLMGIAAGLLQAGGPSRMPTSLGQALGAGLQTGQQFQGIGIQNALQRIQLQQALQGQQYFNSLLNPGGSQPVQQSPQQTVDQTQAPAALGSALSGQVATPQSPPSQPQSGNGLQPISPIAQPALQQAPIPKLAPMQPRLPAVQDPSADPTYQHYIQQARLAEYFKQGSGKPFEDMANARLAALNNQEVTLDPDQAKLLIPGGVLPGQSIKFKPYSGDFSTVGESAIGTVPVQTPQGTTVNMPYDKRSGNIRDPSGLLKQKDYTQPLPSSAQEDMAQRIAAGMMAPPTVSSRNPGAADELARADAIIKSQGGAGYDASTWPAKQKAVSYWNTGKGAQQVTAFNAAESHLETLKPLIDNLNNTNTPAFNHLKNFFASQTGSTAPTNFAAAKQYVGGELSKVVVGSGGTVTEGDRKEAESVLSSANTPEQLKQAIATIQNLIGGKMLALKTQYDNSGMGNFEHRLEGPARTAMQKFQQTQDGSQIGGNLPANGSGNDPLGIR